MKKKVLAIAAIGFFALSGTALAMDDCSKKTSDSEVFACSENNRVVAEKELNKEYSEAKKRIETTFSDEPEVKKAYLPVFLDAQRGWLKYRDNQCKMFAHVAAEKSNPYAVFTNNCIAKLDAQRSNELKEIPYD
ncbi:lysozyme inhibitor LprI family protein [Erwinia sp. CGal63]|uniref:lysozyme inhibitor LprI family protein n=1 Tax=Erwinia sp. CGal63 TaxID=2919889 RepID=UPI0030091B1C